MLREILPVRQKLAEGMAVSQELPAVSPVGHYGVGTLVGAAVELVLHLEAFVDHIWPEKVFPDIERGHIDPVCCRPDILHLRHVFIPGGPKADSQLLFQKVIHGVKGPGGPVPGQHEALFVAFYEDAVPLQGVPVKIRDMFFGQLRLPHVYIVQSLRGLLRDIKPGSGDLFYI